MREFSYLLSAILCLVISTNTHEVNYNQNQIMEAQVNLKRQYKNLMKYEDCYTKILDKFELYCDNPNRDDNIPILILMTNCQLTSANKKPIICDENSEKHNKCLNDVTGDEWVSYVSTRNYFYEICTNIHIVKSQKENDRRLNQLYTYTDYLSNSMEEFKLNSERLSEVQINLEEKFSNLEQRAMDSEMAINKTFDMVSHNNDELLKNFTKISDKMAENSFEINNLLDRIHGLQYKTFTSDYFYYGTMLLYSLVAMLSSYLGFKRRVVVFSFIAIEKLLATSYIKMILDPFFQIAFGVNLIQRLRMGILLVNGLVILLSFINRKIGSHSPSHVKRYYKEFQGHLESPTTPKKRRNTYENIISESYVKKLVRTALDSSQISESKGDDDRRNTM